MSERTIRRSVERMTKGGHVYTILGKPGRGHPNQYWMTLKTGTATPVLDAEKTGTGDRQKTGICDKKTGTATPENHLKNQEADRGCLRNPLSAGERVRVSRDEKSPPSGAPPLTRDPAGDVPRGKISANAPEDFPSDSSADGEKEDLGFRELRSLWQRGHASDDTPKAIAIARNAFAKACSIADATTIMDGAKAWVAAADAPRYLPALPQWLAAKGWEKPPPAKLHHDATSKRGGGRGGGRDRPPRKPSLGAAAFALAARYEAAERERERERAVS
jgi:hypothetical protein